ncbi:MAG: MAPEG family protein [Kofleriaceae bacterium]
MHYVPYLALLAAYALIYIPRLGVVSSAMAAQPGGYNNADPRAQQVTLVGAPRRALAAHHNAIEAFGPFGVAVLAAMQRVAVPRIDLVAYVCIAFIVVRTIYVWAYLADKPNLRSSMWSIGAAATGALMVFAVVGPKL